MNTLDSELREIIKKNIDPITVNNLSKSYGKNFGKGCFLGGGLNEFERCWLPIVIGANGLSWYHF